MGTAIRRDTENPWYWTFDGSRVLLLGGSNTDNLFQWAGNGLESHLDLLVECGGNYVRNTMSDRNDGDVLAFEEIEPGVYDLEQWNSEYWNRLETFLELTAERDVIVELTLWDQHDFGSERWRVHAWNPENTITYDESEAQLPHELDIEQWNERSAFFCSVSEHKEVLLAHQERFVDAILDRTLEHDHVLYNVTNEGWAGIEWERHWAGVLHDRAGSEGKHIEVGNMNMTPDESVQKVIDHPEIFTFVELSQHNQDAMGSSDQEHWDRLIEWRGAIEQSIGPRPINNVKIYGGYNGGNSAAGDADEAVERAWRNLLGGCAAMRFHRPVESQDRTWGIGLTERAQVQIRSMRMVDEAIDITRMGPSQELIEAPESNTAYCAAAPDNTYLVYVPTGRTVDLTIGKGSYELRWLDTERAEWVEATSVSGGRVTLEPPVDRNAIATITA